MKRKQKQQQQEEEEEDKKTRKQHEQQYDNQNTRDHKVTHHPQQQHQQQQQHERDQARGKNKRQQQTTNTAARSGTRETHHRHINRHKLLSKHGTTTTCNKHTPPATTHTSEYMYTCKMISLWTCIYMYDDTHRGPPYTKSGGTVRVFLWVRDAHLSLLRSTTPPWTKMVLSLLSRSS